MINGSLQLFCNRIVEAGRITAADVRELHREIIPDGFADRDEADMLIALERAIGEVDASFGEALTACVVDFAVWGERPTGYVSREVAAWLAGSLGGRTGPTVLGARIAVEVVRAAQSSDERLIAFALATNPGRACANGLPAPMAA